MRRLVVVLAAAAAAIAGAFTSLEHADEAMSRPPRPYVKPDRPTIDEDNPPEPPDERVALIFPGTKWCGPGNVAEHYHDLGDNNLTDRCCRHHDYCDDLIPAGHTAHGLVNQDFYSKLHCDCDETFHRCLHSSDDGVGDIVGKLYFNALGTQCFRLDFPIKSCVKRRGFLRKKCVEYDFDTSKKQIFQWFDVPPFD